MARSGSDILVNHSYKGLAQGVSEQTSEARHESQVEQLENCIPHISRGIIRRNSVRFVIQLKDKDGIDVVPDDYYMYSYDRGTVGEQYVMLIGNRKWYVYKTDGTLVGSFNDLANIDINLDYLDTGGKHPKETFALVTVGDHTWISNNTISTAMSTQTDGLEVDEHKRIAIYWIKNTGNVVTQSDPSTGLVTLEGYTYTLSLEEGDVVTSNSIVGSNANKTGTEIALNLTTAMNNGRVPGNVITITEGPFFKMANWKNVTYAVQEHDDANENDFWWDSVRVAKVHSSVNSVVRGIYTYYKGIKTGSQRWEIYRTHTAVDPTLPPEDGVWNVEGPTMYRRGMLAEDVVTYADSFGNTASKSLKGTIESSSDLPDMLPRGIGEVTIKVVGNRDDSTGDEYWLKWNQDTWIEWIGPGLTNIIDHTTMPHTFLRTEDGSFKFGFYGEWQFNEELLVTELENSSLWNDRTKGDIESAPEPGFIGKKIDDMFIHNNRLGFLAEDAVVLSELSVYGNFFPTTIRSIPATDPIDLIVATSDVTGLKKAVSLSGILLLFSSEAQFSLTGGGGALTPETATIDSVSRYNYSDKAPARVLGNKVMFTTESGNGTQLFSFITDTLGGGTANITADNTSLHIPTFLPTDINYMVSHSILGYLFMSSPNDPKTLYILNTLEVGAQNVQTAFHKWTFDYDIVGMSIVDNALLMLMSTGTNMIGVTMALDVPASIPDMSYQDEYASGVLTNYTSYVTLSKWFLKDGDGFGNKRGRLQIRTALFSVGHLDSFKVEIFNDNVINTVPTDENWVMTNAYWDDTAYWSYNETDTSDSNVIWKDAMPFFSRVYYNDEKVSVTSNSDSTFIRFGSNDLEPTKGFTLATVNMEGLFRQRGTRT